MPDYYSNQPFQQSYQYLDKAAENAMPSPESRDRAYARVRSRLTNERNTRDQELGDSYAGRGMSNAGGYDQAKERSYGQYLSNYGSGMAEVEDNFDKSQQAGSKILGDIGNSYGGIAGEQGKLGVDEGLGQRKLNIDDYNSQTERLRGVSDAFASYGGVGGALGGNNDQQSIDGFKTFKDYLFNLLGLNF